MPDTDTPSLRPVLGGFVIRETDEYTIDVIRMTFNWRLHVTPTEDYESTYLHGYCYFGTDDSAFLRAVAAGLAWADPLNTDPEGYDKKAY